MSTYELTIPPNILLVTGKIKCQLENALYISQTLHYLMPLSSMASQQVRLKYASLVSAALIKECLIMVIWKAMENLLTINKILASKEFGRHQSPNQANYF